MDDATNPDSIVASTEGGARLETSATDPRIAAAELQFPLAFDLRIIYLKAEGPDIVEALEAIYKARGVHCAMIQGMEIPGSKYARMGSRLTFSSRQQMYATYGDIGKLSYVKSAI
ncbi:MAG: hypothetical protein ACOYM2_08690 [Rectinemataceae bacterium]